MTQQQDPAPGGGPGSATAPGSAAGSTQSFGADISGIVDLLKSNPDFLKLIKEEAAKQTQSVKDRRLGKLDKKVQGFEEQLKRYQELVQGGLSDKVALEVMSLGQGRDPDDDDEYPVEPVPTGTSNQATLSAADVLAVVQAAGLELGSSTVTEILRKSYSSPADLMVDVVAAVNKPVQPNPAATFSTEQPGRPNPQQQDLAAEYRRERDAIGYGRPDAMAQLEMKYRKLGYNPSAPTE